MVPGPVTDIAKQVMAIIEANLKASFDYARKLTQAKDLNEMMQLQSDFLRMQSAAVTDQFKEMTNSTIAAGKDAVTKTST